MLNPPYRLIESTSTSFAVRLKASLHSIAALSRVMSREPTVRTDGGAVEKGLKYPHLQSQSKVGISGHPVEITYCEHALVRV
jgi:hypothetical protein